MRHGALYSLLGTLAACADPVPDRAPDALGYTPMDEARLIARASLDLRGVRPDEADLERVASGEIPLDALVEEYLWGAELQDRVLEMFSDTYRTRTNAFLVDTISFGITEAQQARLQRDAGEEPLRIVARIAAEDLPIQDIVTADWSMANRTLGDLFEVDYPSDGAGWEVVHYSDGRPPAGVLSTTGMWWRYDSTDANANRRRANAISRILLCDDYLSREITFDRTAGLLDEDFESRTQSDPACAACHATLDPLASFLYGFSWYTLGGADIVRYHPERERQWSERTGVAPSYYGQPGSTLADLGRRIAGDERFSACVTSTVAEALIGRPEQPEVLPEYERDMIEAGWTLRGLMRSVTHGPAYRAAEDEGVPGGAMPAKLASPALLASAVEALTGFVWKEGDVSLLESDVAGYLTLAGGADGYTVTERAEVPNATILLVQERLAEAAAAYAVDQKIRRVGVARMPWFDALDEAWRPERDAAAMTEVLATAHRRALSREATAEELDEMLALWSELYAIEGDAASAWTGVLSLVLRDPDFLMY